MSVKPKTPRCPRQKHLVTGLLRPVGDVIGAKSILYTCYSFLSFFSPQQLSVVCAECESRERWRQRSHTYSSTQLTSERFVWFFTGRGERALRGGRRSEETEERQRNRQELRKQLAAVHRMRVALNNTEVEAAKWVTSREGPSVRQIRIIMNCESSKATFSRIQGCKCGARDQHHCPL